MQWRTCVLFVMTSLVGLASGGGCASTRIVETWRDPELKGPLDFKRTLIVVVNAPDVYGRNAAESTIVERMGPTRAIAAHRYLSEDERRNRAKLKYRLAQGEVDGVVTMGIVAIGSVVTRNSGAPDPDDAFYAYYDRSAAFLMKDEGETRDTVYRVETRIYRVRDERMVWSALSDTVNPDNMHDAVQDIAKAVGGELRKQKLVK